MLFPQQPFLAQHGWLLPCQYMGNLSGYVSHRLLDPPIQIRLPLYPSWDPAQPSAPFLPVKLCPLPLTANVPQLTQDPLFLTLTLYWVLPSPSTYLYCPFGGFFLSTSIPRMCPAVVPAAALLSPCCWPPMNLFCLLVLQGWFAPLPAPVLCPQL